MADTTLDTVTDEDSRTTAVTTDAATDTDDGIDEDLLIEEVSIDGMCGVY